MEFSTVMNTTFNKTTSTGKTSERKAYNRKDVLRWLNHNKRKYSQDEREKALKDGTIKTNIDFSKSNLNEYTENDDQTYWEWFNEQIPKEVIEAYNQKQNRPCRMIKGNDYFTYLEIKQTKQAVAEQIIMQLGDSKQTKYISQFIPQKEWKKFWRDWAEDTVIELQRLIPEFKIYDVTLHMDESTPHIHIIGVGILEVKDAKKGLTVRVSSSGVFTRERLSELHKELRKFNQKEVEKLNQLLIKYQVKGDKKGFFRKYEILQFTGQVKNKAFNLADVDHLESARFLDAVSKGQISRKDLKRIRLLIDNGKPWSREEEFRQFIEDEYTQRLKAITNENKKLKAENKVIKDNVENIVKNRLETETKVISNRVRTEVSKRYKNAINELYEERKGLYSDLDRQEKEIKNLQNQRFNLWKENDALKEQNQAAEKEIKRLKDTYEPEQQNRISSLKM